MVSVVGFIGYVVVVILYIVFYVIGVVLGMVGEEDLELKDYVKIFLGFFILVLDFVVMVEIFDVYVKGDIFYVYYLLMI